MKDNRISDFSAVLPEKLRTQTIPDKIREALASTDWDGLLLIGVENVQYATGLFQIFARAYLDRPNIVVWPREGNPVLITGGDWVKSLKEKVKYGFRIAGYEENGALPPAVIVDRIADVLREEGLANGLIGLETLRTPAPYFQRLQELVPGARFEPANEMMWRVRMVKTIEEIETLAAGARMFDDAVWRAFKSSKVGDSEFDVVRRINVNILENGCDLVPALILGTGEGARFIGPPIGRRLKAGDLIRFDGDVITKGYWGDLGRIVAVGQPNTEQIKAYRDQVEMKKGIYDFMELGRTCAEVHAFYREQAERMGVQLWNYPYIGCGHSIGVNPDEFPHLLAGFDDWVLEPGMVFAVEPDAMGPNDEVMHTEEMVLVTTDGIEVLTQSEESDWSELLVIPA